MSVVVVGGGWAGIAAAVELTRHQIPVTLLEAGRQLGGRARVVRFGQHHIDNGQHIMLGAYHGVLSILRYIDTQESSVLRRMPLHLSMRRIDSAMQLKAAKLPAPLHLLWGVLRCQLSFSDRLSLLRAFIFMRLSNFRLKSDCSVQEYLSRQKQSPATIQWLWQPICLAALNTPLDQASARIFLRVLRDSFFGTKQDSDMLLPIVDLGACLPQPAMEYIEAQGGSVQLGARVRELVINNDRIEAVRTDDKILEARHIIVATSPEACSQLLTGHNAMATTMTQLATLSAYPIVTLYLKYPETVSLETDFVGLVDCTTQWLFDHGRLLGERGIIAAVISGPGAHMQQDIAQLTALMQREINRYYPHWPKPLESKLIREKRATFRAVSDVDTQRPSNETAIKGLWLAGDYTDTGYPSTLEGAVRSGIRSAQNVLRELQ